MTFPSVPRRSILVFTHWSSEGKEAMDEDDIINPKRFRLGKEAWVCHVIDRPHDLQGGIFEDGTRYVAVFSSDDLVERFIRHRKISEWATFNVIRGPEEFLGQLRFFKLMGFSWVVFDEVTAPNPHFTFDIDKLIEQTRRIIDE
jgi:hypothetical protein